MLEPGGFERMATLSVLAHGTAIAVLLMSPSVWKPKQAADPKSTMMITLGDGAPGPKSGGQTALGDRPVQEVKPPDAPRVREAVRPPAAKVPEMALPDPKVKPSKTVAPNVKEAPDTARGRTPTRGDQTRAGSAAADTGTRGQGFGLSTGGGSGTGSYLDVSNFCCPEYIEIMIDRIRSNWNQTAENAGEVIVKFTIYRDGSIHDVLVEKSSAYAALNLNAQRALAMTRTLPPLPAPFTNPTLTVHLNFQYQR